MRIIRFTALLLAVAAICTAPAMAQTPADPIPGAEPYAPGELDDEDEPRRDKPDKPDKPVKPDAPEEPVKPDAPEEPVKPDAPEEPDKPEPPKPDKSEPGTAPVAAAPTPSRSAPKRGRRRPDQPHRADGDARAVRPSAPRLERRVAAAKAASPKRKGERSGARLLQRPMADAAAGAAPPASATPNREPRLAPDGVSEAIALAGAGRTPRMLLLDAPSDDTGMLLLLGFLLGIAYATGLRCLFRRESFSRRRSGAGALVSRRRVARRPRR